MSFLECELIFSRSFSIYTLSTNAAIIDPQIVPGSLESTESVMVQYGLDNEIKRASEERQSTVKMRSSVEIGLGRSHSKARSSNDEILHERQDFRRPILEHDTSATPMQRDPLSIIKGHQLTVVGKSHVRLTSEENEVDTDSSAETDETEKVIADQGTNSVKSADEGAIQAATVNQTESTSIEEDISATTTTLTPHQEDITPSTKADETDVSETKKKAEPLTSPDTVNVAADETDVSETKKKAEPLTSPGTVIATPDKSGGSVPSPPAKKIPERGDTATAPDGKDTDKGKLIAPVQVGDTTAVAPGIDSSDSSQEIIEVIEEGDGGQWKPLTPAFKVLFAVTGLLIFTIIVGVRSWLNKRSSIKNADTSEPEYDQLLPKDARERDMEAGSSGADEAWGEDWEEDQDENIGTHSNSNSNNNPSNGNGPVSSNRDRPNVIGSQFLSKSKSDKSKDFEVSSSSAFSSSPSSTALPGYQLPTRSSGGLGDRTNNNNSNGPGHSVKRSGSNDDIELSKPIAAPLSAASDYASYRDQKYSNNSSSGGGNNSSASSPSLLSAPCPPPLSSFSASSAGHFAGAKEVATMKGGLGLGSSSGLGLGGRDGGDRGEGRVAPPRVSKPPPSAASDTDFFAVRTMINV